MAAVLEAPSRSRAAPRPGPRRAQPAAPAAGAALAVQALQLLGRWQRVSTGHIALATGCACGIGVGVDLREIDELILDFLNNRFVNERAIRQFVQTHGFSAQGSGAPRGSLSLLLRALATRAGALSVSQAQGLLQTLEGSITSIEEQHQ